MENMRMRIQKMALAFIVTNVAQAAHRDLSLPAWGQPNWGFQSKARTFSKSLIFDQGFDAQSFRPQPALFKIDEAGHPEVIEAPKTLQAALDKLSPYILEPMKNPSTRVEPLKKAELVAPAPQLAEVLAKASPVVETVTPVATPAPSTAVVAERTPAAVRLPAPFKIPQGQSNIAKIFVISEDSVLENAPQPIAGAEIRWISAQSDLRSLTNENGVAAAPYLSTASMRFFVSAKGYLPAMGYAVSGIATPVVLMPESRLPAILTSLNVGQQDAERTLVLGKVLDRKLHPVEGVSIKADVGEPFGIFYDILGLIHPAARTQTGSGGSFFISGLQPGIQYLMPTQKIVATAKHRESEKEWPASIMDFSHAPAVVTVTLQEGLLASSVFKEGISTDIVDAATQERPETDLNIVIGGQSQGEDPETMNADGLLNFKHLYLRGNNDIVEIVGNGYKRVWINGVANEKNFPSVIGLFSQASLDDVFQEALTARDEIDFSKGMILGHLRSEQFTHGVILKVYGSDGRLNRDAKVYYVDESNSVRIKQSHTDSIVQNFVIANLPDSPTGGASEWHLIALDAKTCTKSKKPTTCKAVGAQAALTQRETITQLQL